jgi:hypothetical protein
MPESLAWKALKGAWAQVRSDVEVNQKTGEGSVTHATMDRLCVNFLWLHTAHSIEHDILLRRVRPLQFGARLTRRRSSFFYSYCGESSTSADISWRLSYSTQRKLVNVCCGDHRTCELSACRAGD